MISYRDCAIPDSMFTRSGGRGNLIARPWLDRAKKDGFKASLMTCTSDTVRTHLQRCRTLGEGLLKLCAHQSPYTGRTHRLFPLPQAASVRPRIEPTATPPSRATSRGCYRYANPPPHMVVRAHSRYAITHLTASVVKYSNQLLLMYRHNAFKGALKQK